MVSEVGFGSWGVGGKIWPGTHDATSLQALSCAFEAGVNFVDTALIYGQGHSERLIGEALKNRSEQIYVGTKIPPTAGNWPAQAGVPFRKVFPLRHVKKCTEESLRNLRRDCIDLQQFHLWNAEWDEDDDWHKAVEWIRSKARFVGISVSDHLPDSVISTLQKGLIDCVQVIYNIFDPSPADKLFPCCQHLDVGIIARVPFDEGSLTGAITPETVFEPGDWRARYFAEDRKEQVWQRVERLRHDMGSAEPLKHTALRFCLSHPAVATVIPGMRKAEHVQDNLEAAMAGPLPFTSLELLARHRWARNFY